MLETCMETTVMVVVRMPVPVGRKAASEARMIMTFYGNTRAVVEAIDSCMRREKQRCTAAALTSVELL